MSPSSRAVGSSANKAVADEIAAYRARRRMTIDQVVEASGVPRSTYMRYEHGEREIRVDYLVAICLALGVTPAELVASAQQQSPEAFGLVH